MLTYVERRVPSVLAPYVECGWAVRDPLPCSARTPERIVPDGCPELIVHLGDAFARRVGQRWVAQPRAFLAGTLTRPWLLRGGRRVHTIGIRFRPGAVGIFARLRSGIEGSADREVALAQLVGQTAARDLVDRVRSAAGVEAQIDAAVGWVLARRPPGRSGLPSSRLAVQIINRAHGRIRIDEVARRLSCTRRRLERLFTRELGIRPKLYARIVRLNAVLAVLDEGQRLDAVDLALSAGYFDQAHLLRDFRFLAGRTPAKGRLADGEMARHFTRRDRLKTLLDGE